MNILFHCWEYPPRGSGIGQSIFHMGSALRKLGCYTVIVTSYGDEGPSVEELENGIIYRMYCLQDIGENWLTEEIKNISNKHNIDWIEGADHLGETAGLLKCSDRPRIVIKAHYNDVLKISRHAHAHYFWQKPMINAACVKDHKRIIREKISLAAPDVLIAPSRKILDEMRRQNITLAKSQFVIPNPISPLPAWKNKESSHPTLLLIGRIDIGKGIEYLPGLVNNIIKKFPDLLIEIAGDDSYARLLGSTKKWLVKKMRSNRKHLKFLGQLNRKELDEAYSRAWVVIVPSNWDTFPTVVLEAMQRGKAIVASANGGMPEMLADTENRIADPETRNFSDAVTGFLECYELRKSAGENGEKKAIARYHPETVGRAYLEMLSEAM